MLVRWKRSSDTETRVAEGAAPSDPRLRLGPRSSKLNVLTRSPRLILSLLAGVGACRAETPSRSRDASDSGLDAELADLGDPADLGAPFPDAFVDAAPTDSTVAPDAARSGSDAGLEVSTDGVAPADGVWCATQWPRSTTTAAGFPSELLFARVWVRGVTPSFGANPDLEVVLGAGPAGSPVGSADWSWVPATHNSLCSTCGNDDEWMGRATPSRPGSYVWAARVTLRGGPTVVCDRGDQGRSGSTDGWQSENAPTLAVAAPGSFVVTTINLRCLLDDWDARLPILVDGLSAAHADAIGLQEVCAEPSGRDNLAELLTRLDAATGQTHSVTRTITHRSWNRYEEGIALLSPHRVGGTRVADLPPGAFPRKVIAAEIIGPQGPVVFAVTHLDVDGGAVRESQIGTVLEIVDELASERQGAIVAGDFNEGPGLGVSARLGAAGFVDAWAALRPTESGPTFPASDPASRIDYVMFRQASSGFGVSEVERTFTEPLSGVFASDHFGLRALLRRPE